MKIVVMGLLALTAIICLVGFVCFFTSDKALIFCVVGASCAMAGSLLGEERNL